VGTLHIDGAGIERLVLQDSAGKPMVYYHRERDLVLHAGRYRLEEVVLQGDYSSSGLQIPAAARDLQIEPNGFTTLKLGAPLRQTVKIERWGRSLVLTHQLLGQGGESYQVGRRHGSPAPTCVVYQGERKMASGCFEPG